MHLRSFPFLCSLFCFLVFRVFTSVFLLLISLLLFSPPSIFPFLFCSFISFFLNTVTSFFQFPILLFSLLSHAFLLTSRLSLMFSYFLNIMIDYVNSKLIKYVVAISTSNYELIGKKILEDVFTHNKCMLIKWYEA